MGKSTVDMGKNKSKVAGGNWPRTADLKKTAKLGTEKNPAVVRVRTEERLKEVSSSFDEGGWKYKASLEPDKPENIADLERLVNPPKPIRVEKKLGRNELCSCGSGKKYKSCCLS